ncbi:MAG: OsmC family protein [Bacteroidota bacterium]
MEKYRTIYSDGLRTQITHLRSGATIITDAPVDNHGKGESFSPTDMMTASLASCMLTMIGIAAQNNGFSIDGAVAESEKVMGTDPRRVIEINISISFPAHSYSEKEKRLIEHTAHHCPVSKSLHPDLKKTITFNY